MVFVTNKFLAILFLLPGGALAVRGTSSDPPTALPDCSVVELSVPAEFGKKRAGNYNALKSFGVNQLLSPIDAIELDEVAFIGAQWFQPVYVRPNEDSLIFETFGSHCTGLEGVTMQNTHIYEKPVCDLGICFKDQEKLGIDETNDCIQMRYFSGSREEVLEIPGAYQTRKTQEEPEEPNLIAGTVLGGTGIYSNVIGGEFGLKEFSSGGFGALDGALEFKMIACSDESTSSTTTNEEQAPIPSQGRIAETFDFTITKVKASVGFSELVSDVAIEAVTSGIVKTIKTGTLQSRENPSYDDSKKFISIYCTVLDTEIFSDPGLGPGLRFETEEQTCNFDLVYGNDKQGEPNSIFLKATVENLFEFYEFPVGDAGGGINVGRLTGAPESFAIDATVLGGTGKYRSAGGKARITLASISGQVSAGTVSGDNPLQSGTILVELIPYFTGVDLWGDRLDSN